MVFVEDLGHLYLLEVKSALENSHITGMRERLLRTVEFIALCGNGQMEAAVRTLKNQTIRLQTCGAWAAYAGATKVYGVIGGIGFTQQMLLTAETEGFMSVVPRDGIYDIHVPGAGLTSYLRAPASGSDASEGTTQPVVVTSISEEAVCMFASKLEEEQGHSSAPE